MSIQRFNYRKWLYLKLVGLRGQEVEKYYKLFKQEDQQGVAPDTTKKLLIQVLEHAKKNVPYYREIMNDLGGSFYEDPQEYLKRFPVLTKDLMRTHQEELKSADLNRRKWQYNSSGGSTGRPGRFIQDREFASRVEAMDILTTEFYGRELGENEMIVWGSIHDLEGVKDSWKARLIQRLINTDFVNAFKMSPELMHHFVKRVNEKKPKLILTYAESIYELARFIEREGLHIVPPKAIVSTASSLHPFMREKVEEVFRCKVYDRYGSREVGFIAGERPGWKGYWVAPWSNYVEIVDEAGNQVPDGMDGDIVITSLTNYGMPLIRYRVADRGIMSPECAGKPVQVLESVLGRTVDHFKTKEGTLVSSCYFTMVLFLRDWIKQFQVIQKDVSCIVFRIVPAVKPEQSELEDITARVRLAMGKDCDVQFEFVDDIPPVPSSGKRRYTICEIMQ